MFKINVFSLSVIIFWSCSNPNIEHTLKQAGNNRIELESYLSHYSGDTKKKEAASFLIAGMANKGFYEGELIDRYNVIFHLFDSLRNEGIDDGDPLIITNT